MAGSFPSLPGFRSGLQHSILIRAQVNRFRSGKEQRFATSGVLNSFRIPYSGIPWTHIQALETFHVEQKGAFDYTWSLSVLDPSTRTLRAYQDMAFATDEFTYTERPFQRYDITLEATQTVAEAIGANAPAAEFPTLSNGVRVQLPFTTTSTWNTERNDLPSGKRITRFNWPNRLRRWNLDFTVIEDSELKVFVDFYLGQNGPVHPFAFTDPNTFATHANCRLSPDPLVITRVTDNINRLSVAIEQFTA